MNIRRRYVPNAAVFITQAVFHREPVFAQDWAINLLREVLRNVKTLYPFTMLGYIFLPDHFHLLIRPEEKVRHSQILHSLKSNFTYQYKAHTNLQGSLRFWQKRYWDHVIRNEEDFRRHLDYIHYNPVKHGLVTRPEAWPHSSFLAWKKRGAYSDRWGWSLPDSLSGFTQDLELE